MYVFAAINFIVYALYGFAEGLDHHPAEPITQLHSANDKVVFIGDIYHNLPTRKIKMIKVVRTVTHWNLPQTKSFLDECERIYLGGNDVLARLDKIIEENER